MEAKSTDYIRLLRRFPKNVLIEAYDDVLRQWGRPQWPPPGLFYTRAKEITARDRKPPEHWPAPEPTREQLRLPHEKVMAILDECGPKDPGLRRMLYRMGTGGREMPIPGDELGDAQTPMGKALTG